jgi:Planctomycete cytochrome C
MSTAGSGSGGMSSGGSVGTGGDGAGGSAASGGAGGAAGHLGSGGSAGNSGGGASGGHKGTGGTAGHAGGGTTGTGGGQAATFTQVYTMVLDAPSSLPSSCAGNGCHVSAAGAAGISFDTQAHAYQTLLGEAVVPGNAAKSVLYTNIASGAMPRGRPKLSATLIALVASWINAGALND